MVYLNLLGLPKSVQRIGWATYNDIKSTGSLKGKMASKIVFWITLKFLLYPETSKFFFVVQTESELLIWKSAPLTVDSWLNPWKQVLLVQSRIVSDDDMKIQGSENVKKAKCKIYFK